eukprot:scaffold4833_cov233-Amphora_coffeaeformis.AAC.20
MAKSPPGDKPPDPLKDLLASLASGARAVSGIPVEDDYSFQASFPEFAAALNDAQESLRGIVFDILEDQTDIQHDDEVDDPFLLEQAADLCDVMMEQLESYLQQSGSESGQVLQDFAQSARNRSKKSFRAMMDGIVEMEKPQKIYGINIPDNRRRMPFIPKVHPKKPHGTTPLDLSLKNGSGWESRFGGTKSAVKIPDDMVLPKKHVAHPYQTEIETFRYTTSQLKTPLDSLPTLPMPKGPSPLPFTWVDTTKALDDLARQLRSAGEIAMDLEAHNYRSFAGFLCLMQISIRGKDQSVHSFLVDTLALHGHLNAALADPLADPAIVKIFHGADSDIAWLQRDLGLYVVNLFDTGRAARALKFSSASYAYLLMRYFGIQADKTYQLADWRQRPLPADMKEYAVQDTHYLLTIYDCLRFELIKQKETSIEEVLDVSRKVCLIRYAGEGFRPSGYQALMGRGRGSKTELRLTETQESVLAALWDWRDATARKLDESVSYILPNDSLWRLALSMPRNLTSLQTLFQPMPANLMTLSADLLHVIKEASSAGERKSDSRRANYDEEEDDDDLDEDLATQHRVPSSSSSAFFKPTPVNERQRRGMMSPVMGTEALYKQAGWMTPQEVVSVGSSTTDTDDKYEGLGKPKRLLSVHSSNTHFRAKQVSNHSIELSSGDTGRGRTADGMATVRAARDASGSPRPLPSSAEDVAKAARQSSVQVRNRALSKDAIPSVLSVLGQSAVSNEMDEEEDEEGPDDVQRDQKVEEEEEDFVIPRSIREIYKISNRNRSNKKTYSPTPERGVTPTDEKEREELARAEKVLRENSDTVGYLFDQSKRPRTKSTGGSEGSPASPEGGSAPSKEEDLAYMREVCWVQPHESNESILSQQYGSPVTVEETSKTPYYEYAPVAMSSAAASANANPFFSGAALQGGALTNPGNQKQRKSNNRSGTGGGRGSQSNRRQERPEKKDGRSFAYRGKR